MAEKAFSRVLIVNDNLEFLCVLQKYGDKFMWNFPGGKINQGEMCYSAARREVKEEIGLELLSFTHLIRKKISISGETWKGFFYIASGYLGEYSICEKNKVYDIKFMNLDEMSAVPAIRSVFFHVAKEFMFEVAATSLFYYRYKAIGA